MMVWRCLAIEFERLLFPGDNLRLEMNPCHALSCVSTVYLYCLQLILRKIHGLNDFVQAPISCKPRVFPMIIGDL